MKDINIIVAYSSNRVIGKDNTLIWSLPADLKRFKELTTETSVIMGRKTYESISKPLPKRENIIITRNKDFQAPGCIIVSSLDEAIKVATKDIFIIGGSQIYEQALEIATRIHATVIHQEFEGDTYFPAINDSWIKLSKIDNKIDEKNLYNYSYITYEKAQF